MFWQKIFNTGFFNEVIQSLKYYKLRNILTGFGVAWGIFILIILLGAGQGLQDGISKLFSSYAKNSVWIYPGQISETTKNNKSGEKIVFTKELFNKLKTQFYQIKKISPEVNYTDNSVVNYENKNQTGRIKGIGQEYFDIKLLNINEGREFNERDYIEQRPVCIIGYNMSEIFKSKVSIIGKYINISGSWFKIIGILAEGGTSGYGERNAVYIPLPSFYNSFGNNNEYSAIGMLLDNNLSSVQFDNKLKDFLSRNLNYDIEDSMAVFIMNQNEQIKQFNSVFTAVKLFLWFVGISMLLTGIIGVGNIMLVVVKERTKEIGIRKAIGARSISILLMIVSESVIITLSAGIVGMILGMIVVKIADVIISNPANTDNQLIDSFSINFPVIIGALLLLLISGALAGIIPARKAARIMPAQTLNDE